MSDSSPGGSAGEPGPAPDRRRMTEHDRRRLRVTRRVALLGPLLGIAAAATVGWMGASGAAGLAVLLLLSSAGCLLAAFVTTFGAMVDEYRRVPVARRRTLTALGLFAGGALLLFASFGAGAGAG
jgi:hypothetical protein